MRWLGVVVVLCWSARLSAAEDTLKRELQLGTQRVRFDISVHGQPPQQRWTVFMTRLFDFVDRNGDGALSATEAARLFPLPDAGGKPIRMDFTGLDVNRDGKGSRLEFASFYQRSGFAPVLLSVESGDKVLLQPSDALLRRIDSDENGRLTLDEIAGLQALPRKLDVDEDEVLSVAELLAESPPEPRLLAGATAKIVDVADLPDVVLRIAWTDANAGPSYSLPDDKNTPSSSLHMQVPGGVCTAMPSGIDAQRAFRATRDFHLAQFQTVLDGRAPLRKADLEDDPAMQGLTPLFDAADSNGDGGVGMAEINALFELLEMGVQCQVFIVVQDRGHNLFDLIDTDRNDRLDLPELARAERSLRALMQGAAALDRSALPRQYTVTAWIGRNGGGFGPISLPNNPVRTASVTPKPKNAPAWFEALDRNGDGLLSPREFIGPRSLFQRLDADRDGFVSAREAQAQNSSGH